MYTVQDNYEVNFLKEIEFLSLRRKWEIKQIEEKRYRIFIGIYKKKGGRNRA